MGSSASLSTYATGKGIFGKSIKGQSWVANPLPIPFWVFIKRAPCVLHCIGGVIEIMTASDMTIKILAFFFSSTNIYPIGYSYVIDLSEAGKSVPRFITIFYTIYVIFECDECLAAAGAGTGTYIPFYCTSDSVLRSVNIRLGTCVFSIWFVSP